MPLTEFICPGGNRVSITQCRQKCSRPEGRCLSLPTLIAIADRRPWTGKPSTTQLLNGTRLTYLEITTNYAVDPFDRAFALLGTVHHRRLEVVAQKLNALAEEKLDAEVTGILDLLVPDESAEKEAYELWDYKTSGSFKVAKALGMVGKKVPDPSGARYEKSGSWGKAGDPKMITVWEREPAAADMWDWELQLNKYRVEIEIIGFPISRMFIQATVRDGGTMVANNRGITDNIIVIPVKRLDDSYVKEYYRAKREALLTALEKKELPPPCDSRESWGGKRCRSYCDVWEFCDVGRKARQ